MLPQVGSPLAAFTVGQGTTTLALAGFTALIGAARAADGAIPTADQDFQGAEGDLHAKQGELEDFVTAALEQGRSQFAVGTAQREIIDAIPTGSGGGGASGPGVPSGVTFFQEIPGEAVLGNANEVPGATLYKVYAREVGSGGEPVLAGSGETLPLSVTMAPGVYEFSMLAANGGGESERSALTVA